MKVVFIGAGNVATHLSAAMRQAGLCICQIYSRTEENAQRLAAEHACAWTTDTGALRSDADLYVFALKDAVLHKIVTQVSPNEGLWLHTAGRVRMDIFADMPAAMACFIRYRRSQKNDRSIFGMFLVLSKLTQHKANSVCEHLLKRFLPMYGCSLPKNGVICIWPQFLPVTLQTTCMSLLIGF